MARLLRFPSKEIEPRNLACAVCNPHDDRALRCSLPAGHDGMHVAGGPHGEIYSLWFGGDDPDGPGRETTKGDDDAG